MALRVHVLCRNIGEDRILPRLARYLRDGLGWTAGMEPPRQAEAIYLMAYFEGQPLKPWPSVPVLAYLTHREEEPVVGNTKAALFDEMAKRAAVRIVTCRKYGEMVERYGPTVQPALPVERERFTLGKRRQQDAGAPGRAPGTPVVGVCGFTYSNHRKGEDLIKAVVGSKVGRRVTWLASGRGWPIPGAIRQWAWVQMPQFYQSLDVLVVPSRVEGGPMTTLEALACGVRVVIPRHVGLHDELPEMAGIYRYERGNAADLVRALEQAAYPRDSSRVIDREALRAAVAGHSVEAWCQGNLEAARLAVEPHPQPLSAAERGA